jgi:predicted negative regulator of RcsB-dependent stress response
VDSFRTEEEQIEAIKRWWKDNGVSTLIGIALALALVFGWQSWQKNQTLKAENASAIYQQLLAAEQQVEANAVNLANVHHLAGQLKSDYSGTSYAQYAALILAKHAVETRDLDIAEKELQWVMEQSPTLEIEQLTRLRLSRVLFAQDRGADAMKMLKSGEAGSFEPAYQELVGDIELESGNLDKALLAYQKAKELTEQAGLPLHPFLLMKLVDLESNENREVKQDIDEKAGEQEEG